MAGFQAAIRVHPQFFRRQHRAGLAQQRHHPGGVGDVWRVDVTDTGTDLVGVVEARPEGSRSNRKTGVSRPRPVFGLMDADAPVHPPIGRRFPGVNPVPMTVVVSMADRGGNGSGDSTCGAVRGYRGRSYAGSIHSARRAPAVGRQLLACRAWRRTWAIQAVAGSAVIRQRRYWVRAAGGHGRRC